MANTKVDTSQRPYYNDYDENKKQVQILFRPGISVQARELTQLQSILQKQIERFGKHVFKDGSMVIPGEVSFDLGYNYIIVNRQSSSLPPVDFQSSYFENAELIQINDDGSEIIEDANNKALTAKVVSYVDVVDSQNNLYSVLYVKYIPGLNAGTTVDAFEKNGKFRIVSEHLPVLSDVIGQLPNVDTVNVEVNNSYMDVAIVGVGSAAMISDGVYFVRGYFVKVTKQTIILDPYSNEPSYRVGFDVQEYVVTEKEDLSLLSGASGSPNYAAPGAHRLVIDLVLSKIVVQPDEEPRTPVRDTQDFIELLVLKDGFLYKQIKYSDYDILEKTLARRTYDESGDYTVRPFKARTANYLDDGTNNGVYRKYLLISGLVFSSGNSINVGDTITQTSSNATGTVYLYNPVTRRLQFFQTSNSNFAPTNPLQPSTLLNISRNQTQVAQANITEVIGDDYENKIAVIVDPGKAYIKGHEIEKITSEVVAVRKSRDFLTANDMTVTTAHGNTIRIKNMIAIPDADKFASINLFALDSNGDPTVVVGTANVKLLEYYDGVAGYYDNGVQTNSDEADDLITQYLIYLADVQMIPGHQFEEVHSIGKYDFFANIVRNLYSGQGTITLTAGQNGQINILGSGTNFTRDLSVGDIITINPANRSKRQKIRITAEPTSAYNVVGKLQNNPDENGYTTLPANQVAYYLEYSELAGIQERTLLFKTPHANLKSISDAHQSGGGLIDNSFCINRIFRNRQTALDGNGNITLTLLDSTENFATATLDDYVVVRTNDYTVVKPNSVIISPDPHICVINVDDDNLTYNVQAIIRKGVGSGDNQSVSSSYKLKGEETITVSVGSEIDAKKDIIPLGVVDAFEIVNIWMSPDFSTAPGAPYTGCIDIKDRYTLDNGQKDNYYDYSSVVRKKNNPFPTGQLLIIFKRFSRSQNLSRGMSYYCVNSYPDYDNIPDYMASDGTRYPLRDCLDFRPDITDIDNTLSFIELPIPTYNFKADYQYYLNRIDTISISADGVIRVTEGRPDVEPTSPTTPISDMAIYYADVPAYTYKAEDVKLKFIENKRYTMRDINKLENRIYNLEYYTSLSLLEKDTADMSFKDEETGMDRYKLGFIVDPFTSVLGDDAVADRSSPECRCAIDKTNHTLQPQQNAAWTIPFTIESNPGAVVTVDDVIMLEKQSDVLFIEQPFATYLCNLTPYDDPRYKGTIKLNPTTDNWKESKVTDPETITIDNGYQALEDMVQSMGTVINSVEQEWSGTKTSDPKLAGKQEKIGQSYRGADGTVYGPFYYADYPGQSADERGRSILKQINKMRAKSGKKPLTKLPHPTQWVYDRKYQSTSTGTLTTVKEGVQLSVKEGEPITQKIGERVTSVNYAQHMRSIIVEFTAKRFKPNTIVYPFFDNKPVSDYCSTIQPHIDLGRKIVLTPTELKANEFGEIHGWFKVPNDNKLKFETGMRTFRLTDLIDNKGDPKSIGETQFFSEGLVETKQGTILSIRNPEIISTPIDSTESVTITNTSEYHTEVKGKWIDPIAQTIIIDTAGNGGIFVSKIDVWFASRSAVKSVELQIREVVNGYPSSDKVLPFARVIKNPEDVTVVPTREDLKNLYGQPEDGCTTFEFATPVYLEDGIEYAIVLISDSTDYQVYVANASDALTEDINLGINKNLIITPASLYDQDYRSISNKYMGSFFTSQNSTTWTADQYTDLKFRLWKAQFDTSSAGVVTLVNEVFPDINSNPETIRNVDDVWQDLPANPLQIAPNSPNIRVYHPNHGFRASDRVNIKNIQNLKNYDTGDPITELLDVLITSVDVDDFTINVGYGVRHSEDAQKDTYYGRLGGSEIRSTYSKRFDTLQPLITETNYNNQTYTTYNLQSTNVLGNTLGDIQAILPEEKISFGATQIVNPTNSGSSAELKLVCNMRSENPNLTPMIDAQRLSAVAIMNRINDPAFDNEYVAGLDDIVVVSGRQISLEQNKIIITTVSSVDAALYDTKFTVGKYLSTNSGTNTNKSLLVKKEYNGTNYTLYTNTSFTQETIQLGTITQYDHYIDEIGPRGGSAAAKYLTKKVSLEKPATALRIQFPAYRGPTSNIDVYYKVQGIGDKRKFDDIEFTKAIIDTEVNPSTGEDDFKNYYYTINSLDPFIFVQVKIVMRGTNGADVPRIHDLRVIALDA